MDLKACTGPQRIRYYIKGPYCSTLNISFCLEFSQKAITKWRRGRRTLNSLEKLKIDQEAAECGDPSNMSTPLKNSEQTKADNFDHHYQLNIPD